jgi:hypothetical protein
MGWVIAIVVVLVVLAVLRRVLKGRTAPQIDQSRLAGADYGRIGQDVRNADMRYGK